MNLEEWLEKLKEKPGTVWCKSNAYPPNKCRYCNKGLYKRGVYKHSRFLTDINTYCCTACKEERERAKQRDPFFEFDKIVEEPWDAFNWTVPPVEHYNDRSFIVDNEAIAKLRNVLDKEKEERVHDALELLQKEFKEVKITL
ncbi:hypothetical protein AXI71_gp01 [Lactococcus phage GE1]|uniref:Uncharacterized protein n=1 Tax=Lactococcus phage GE1 TaxID=1698369 RepID=A0A0N9BAU2_9CAUD|nr:hypothetical protein AXI71_gp01 [Lactococcus phage GE1]ALA06955.1 hypothetical protein [Lactococcus phage GE1]